MSDIELTAQQKKDIKQAIDTYRQDKKEIRFSGLSEVDENIALLKLSKAFLDTHKEVAFHYQCSGRGLPARDYHMRVSSSLSYLIDPESFKHLIDDDYLAKIQINIERYKANIDALQSLQTGNRKV